MKYLIIILFFVALTCEGQVDTMVCIKPSTAMYFLERDDIATILTKKDSLNTQRIFLLEQKTTLLDSVTVSYKKDSVVYNNHIVTQREVISLKQEEIKRLKKNTRLKSLGAGIVIFLILILK